MCLCDRVHDGVLRCVKLDLIMKGFIDATKRAICGGVGGVGVVEERQKLCQQRSQERCASKHVFIFWFMCVCVCRVHAIIRRT